MKPLFSNNHFLDACDHSRNNSKIIVSDKSTGLDHKVIHSGYFLGKEQKIYKQDSYCLDIPSYALKLPSDYGILGAENTPISLKTGNFYMNGVSFASTTTSQNIMMEDILVDNLEHIPRINFNENICCISTYKVFGHFLFQTCLKLISLQVLGIDNSSIIVLTGDLPDNFFRLANQLKILPKRYCITSKRSLITTLAHNYVLASTIYTTGTPTCNKIQVRCTDELARTRFINNKVYGSNQINPLGP